MNGNDISRRNILQGMVCGSVFLAAENLGGSKLIAEESKVQPAKLKGRIKQSVSKWCFDKIPIKDFCKACADMGIGGIDLVGPGDWPTLKEFGLIGTCTPSHGLPVGFNHKENHEACIKSVKDAIDKTSAAGYPNVICFSGNRNGISDEEGAANCVEGLKKVIGYAEEKKVTLIMELLNSKVNHKDYQADNTAWAADVCKKVGSPRMKLLYDIYHMQIMGDNLVETIKSNIEYIGHFHTAGVPGRNEIDSKQQINYPEVMKVIAKTKYTGWVAHEFVPKRDPLTSLREAVQICGLFIKKGGISTLGI